MRTSIRRALLFALALAAGSAVSAQATFSIVAVDPETGEVGSAGASCISGSIILSDVHPGVGGVHTQAYWNAQNQQYARTLMNAGYSPEAIVDSVVAHDAQGNPSIRQYGVVDLVGGGRSATYTGSNCTDYHGGIPGPVYAIQGNILLGPEILESMESAFLNTPGTLADRLMAALQGAKVPGADTRCRSYGKSSISAFLRVAAPTDPDNDLFLDLNVNNTPSYQDPIDVLQGLYDQWLATSGAPSEGRTTGPDATDAGAPDALTLYAPSPNPFVSSTIVTFEIPRIERVTVGVYDLTGRRVAVLADGIQAAGLHKLAWSGSDGQGSGVFLVRVEAGDRVLTRKVLKVRG